MPLHVASLERVHSPSRQVHALSIGRLVQAPQHGGQSWSMGRLDAGRAPFLEEGFQALVPEGLDHGALYRVALHAAIHHAAPRSGITLPASSGPMHKDEAIKKPYRGLLRITGRMIRLTSA